MPSTGGDEPGLGTLWGVFLPCTQNILGVILFIRLPFIVGQAGIWLTMAVIACCVLTTVLTSLSLSAIATNGRIKAGGPYFAISRNLGAPMGGAVGLLFYLGTTLGATMYVLGAVEALQVGFGLTDLFPMDRELLAVGTMLLLGACVFMGVAFVSRIAPVFLAVVIVSILLGLTGVVLFAAGVDYGQPEDIASASSLALGAEFQPDPDTGATPSFVSLLGLFYPSVTGIMAGANRSGVLANPGQSIPLGTLGAIGTTTALYLLVTWLYGAFVDRATLIANKLVFASLAWPIRYIVNVGIVMSSIGAGMQSLTGAPQLLAVMRRDGVVPSIPTPVWLRNLWAADTPSTDSSAHSKGESAAGSSSAEAGVPEVLITVVLAALPCLAGNIDNITPIQTIFFLMLYGSINLACLVLALLRTPNFRPVWRHFAWWTCAAGVLACAAIMMLVSWWQALAGITVAVALYYWIQRTGESLQWGTWGDSIASVRLHQASTALLSLRSVAMHPKNWRPQLLVLTNTDADGVPTRPGLLHVAGQLKKGQGLTVVATVRQGSLLSLLNRAREEYRTLLHQLGEQGVSEGEATRTAARLLARGIENPSAAEIAAVTADAKGDDALMLEDPEIVVLRSAEAVMQKSMLSAGVDGFAQVVHSVHREDGLVSLLQTAGLGALSPNMVMLGWPGEIVQWEGEGEDQHPTLRDRAAAGQYVSLLKTSLAMRKSILVLKGDADPDLHSPVPMRGTIDIWWVRVDSGLLLLLPFLLTRHPKWAQCKLRLFAVVSASDASPGATKERLEAYLANARIVAEVYTVAIAGDVADAAVANRTLNLEARNLLAQVAHASTMTMAASDLKPETPSRTARRSVMDVFGAAPAQGGGEGDASTTTGVDTMPAVAEEDGEAADTPEDAGTGEPSVARSQSLREQRLRHAMALNAAISQHSSDAALVVTNLFVSRSADAKTFMLETEVCTAGVARALLVRGTGGELVTSFETTLEGFVGLADRPEGFTESQVASEEGGVSADSETEASVARASSALQRCMPHVAARAMSGTAAPLNVFTEDEVAIREAVSKFAKEEIAPKVLDMDRDAKIYPEVLTGLFEQGFMGIEIPQEHGGTGSSFTAACLMIEELAKVDAAVSVCADVQNTLVNNVFRFYASPEMQAKVFPKLAADTVGCFCLSEATSGSDAFAMKTKAEDKGDHWLINGSKLWITNGGEAGLYIVMANTDFSKGYKGITAFLCEAGMEGITVGKKEDKLGIRASSTTPITFENVKVPKENVIGEVGKGYKIAIEILNEGRIGIAAQMLGIAQGAYDTCMPYLFERKQFGTCIGDFQGMQHQYAQAAVDIEAARALVYNAARLKEAGQPFVKEAAMAKLYASQVAQNVATKSIEWMGGVGFTKEYGVEKYFRDARIGAIYEGTSNIQLQTIAKLVRPQYAK